MSPSDDRMEMRNDEALEVIEVARRRCPNTTASITGIEKLGHAESPSAAEDGWYHFY